MWQAGPAWSDQEAAPGHGEAVLNSDSPSVFRRDRYYLIFCWSHVPNMKLTILAVFECRVLRH